MCSTYHIIKSYAPSLKEDLSRKAIDKGKPDLGRKQVPELGHRISTHRTRKSSTDGSFVGLWTMTFLVFAFDLKGHFHYIAAI